MNFYKDYFWTYSEIYGFTFAYISLVKVFVWRGKMYALLKCDLEKHNFHKTGENTFLDLMTVLEAE